MAKRKEYVCETGTLFGKRISKILTKVEKQRASGKDLTAAIDMAKYVCDVRDYLMLPYKKVRRFSSITRASLYEKSDDVAAMAIAAAYRDVFGTDAYMIDGDRYGTEFFMPKTRDGIVMWDAALMAISADPDIKQKTIYDLMINSYTKACFASMCRVKEEMEKHMKPEDDKIIKLHTIEVVGDSVEAEEEPIDDNIIDGDFKEVPSSEIKSTRKDNGKSKEVKTEQKGPAKAELKKDEKETVQQKKEENIKIVDPAEAEHPQDDMPEPGSGEVDPKPGPKEKKYTEKKTYTFSEAMKGMIKFDNADGEKEEDDHVAPIISEPRKVKYPEIVADIPNNNAQFHNIYPKLQWFTDLMKANNILVSYRMTKFPFGDLINVCAFGNNGTTFPNIGWAFIDPNVLYRDGYNVLTMSNNNGDILREIVCPMKESFETMIVKIVKGSLNKKEQRNLLKMRPICTRKVFEMIDFTGLGHREPLDTREWTLLIENLGDIIENNGIKYRMKISDYVGPENFKLLCDQSVIPVGTNDNDLILIKPITEPNTLIHYCPETYKDNKLNIFVMDNNGVYQPVIVAEPAAPVTNNATADDSKKKTSSVKSAK